MYRFLTAIGLLAAAVLIVTSATMNYVFASSLGKTAFEGYVLGTVSVAVDVLKALLAIFVAKAARDGQRNFVVIGSIAFALFAIGSFVAAAGFSSVNRGAVTDGRRTMALELSEVEQELARARAARDGLSPHRPRDVVEEALQALHIDPRWSASGECVRPSNTAHRELCTNAAVLRLEAATAKEAARLDGIIATMLARKTELRAKGAGQSADPQARFLAESLGLSESSVQRLLMSLIALIVEVSSALGIYLATGHGRARGRRSSSSRSRTKRRASAAKKSDLDPGKVVIEAQESVASPSAAAVAGEGNRGERDEARSPLRPKAVIGLAKSKVRNSGVLL